MNEVDFLAWISLAWVLVSPLVISKLVDMARLDRVLVGVLAPIGGGYLLTVAAAVYLAHKAFSGRMSDGSFAVFFFLAANAPLWILVSPFVIHRFFKNDRPQWAWVAILLVVGAVMIDWIALGGIAGTQTFRN